MPLTTNSALSGPDSHRQLGSEYGDIRRVARRLKRDGLDGSGRRGGAGILGGLAAQAALNRPRIGSADADVRFGRLRDQEERANMEMRRRSELQGSAPDAPDSEGAFSSDLGRSALIQKRDPAALGRAEARGRQLGIPQDRLNTMLGRGAAPAPGATPTLASAPGTPTPPSAISRVNRERVAEGKEPVAIGDGAVQIAGQSRPWDSDRNGIPNSIQRPIVSKIDGRPAQDVLGEMRGAAQKSPAVDPEKAYAEYRKSGLTQPRPEEVGNMADIRKRDFVGPPAPPSSAPGPLQRALNDALARRQAMAKQGPMMVGGVEMPEGYGQTRKPSGPTEAEFAAYRQPGYSGPAEPASNEPAFSPADMRRDDESRIVGSKPSALAAASRPRSSPTMSNTPDYAERNRREREALAKTRQRMNQKVDEAPQSPFLQDSWLGASVKALSKKY